MIDHVLREVTEDTGTGGVILGGNVRGVSNLQLLKDVGPDSLAVFELDSWQLQGFGEAKISPQVAVFTSFMPDHMNYYHNDLDAYFADKAQIFEHQTSKDTFVTTPQVFGEATAYAYKHGLTLGGEVVLADVSVLPEDFVLSMPGEHNRLNAALAVEALRALSLPDELIFSGLATFRGVPGRLELLGERKGVHIYNDNNATTPEATVQGLRAIAEGKNVVLIAGGADKDLPLQVLVREIGIHTKEVFLIPGTGTEKLAPLLPTAKKVSTLEEAVSQAFEAAENGDVILFSPGFASFGMFQNEYERNDVFVALVRATL
jgi:UDP-N-acetylmuramoylalanine--D-glutamate ligase